MSGAPPFVLLPIVLTGRNTFDYAGNGNIFIDTWPRDAFTVSDHRVFHVILDEISRVISCMQLIISRKQDRLLSSSGIDYLARFEYELASDGIGQRFSFHQVHFPAKQSRQFVFKIYHVKE